MKCILVASVLAFAPVVMAQPPEFASAVPTFILPPPFSTPAPSPSRGLSRLIKLSAQVGLCSCCGGGSTTHSVSPAPQSGLGDVCGLVAKVPIAQLASAPKSTSSLMISPSPADSTLNEQIQKKLEGFKGNVWIYAKNLATGKDYRLHADEQVRTASTIKLPIMAATYHLVAQGKLHWNDELIVTKEQKKGGSGVLRELSDNTKIDLQSAVNLMIVVSDNTATNLVLDKVTCDGVNAYMDTIGLTQTRSLRHVFGGGEAKAWDDPKMKKFGLAVSSPKEMVRLLEMLHKGEVVSKEASAQMVGILKRQQYKDGIGRNLTEVASASKSGTLDRLRSDVGIIYTTGGPIAMAITIDDMPEISYTPDNPGLHMIWELSQLLQTGLAK